MRDLPRLNSTVQIQPQAADTSSALIAQLNRLGTNLQKAGSDISVKATRDMVLASAQQGATDIESKAIQLKEEAAAKFPDTNHQQEFFNSGFNSYKDSYINNSPEGAKGYLTKTAGHVSNVQNTLYSNDLIKQEKIQSNIDYFLHQNNNTMIMNHAISVGDFGNEEKGQTGGAQKAYQQLVTSAKLAATQNIITPSEMNSQIIKAQKNYQAGRFMFHVQQTIDNTGIDSATKMVEDVQKKGIPSYSSTDLITLTNKARALINQHKMATLANVASINNNAKNNLDNAINTGRVNDQWTQDYTDVHPKLEQNYKDTLNKNLEIHSEVNTLTTLPFSEQENKLSTIKDTKDFDTFNAIQIRLNKSNAQIKDDPFSFFLKNPQVEESLIQKNRINNGLQNAPLMPSDQMIQTNPVEANLISQKIKGIADNDLAVMPKASAQQEVNAIHDMPMEKQFDTLESMKNAYGKNFPIALKQLNKAGLPMASQLVLTAAENNTGARPVLMQAFNQPIKELQAAVGVDAKDIKASVDDTLSKYLNSVHYNGTSASTINNIKAQVYQLAYQNSLNGQSSGDAAQSATDTLINDNYTYPTLINSQTRLPKEVDEGQAKQVAELLLTHALNAKNLKVPAMYFPGVSKESNEEQYRNDIATAGDVVADPSDAGLVAIDGNGNPLLDSDGKRFFLSYDDIDNPNSQIIKDLKETPAERDLGITSINKSLPFFLQIGALPSTQISGRKLRFRLSKKVEASK